MKILIQQACIIDPSSPHNGAIRDILIENGLISAIENTLSDPEATLVGEPGLHVSPGWVDVFSHFCDPGYEHKETLETGAYDGASEERWRIVGGLGFSGDVAQLEERRLCKP